MCCFGTSCLFGCWVCCFVVWLRCWIEAAQRLLVWCFVYWFGCGFVLDYGGCDCVGLVFWLVVVLCLDCCDWF